MSQTKQQPTRASRRPVTADQPIDRRQPDYADEFELCLDSPDPHTAEQWARAALEQGPTLVRGVVVVAQAGVLRLDLHRHHDRHHVLGWRITRAEPDEIHLAATGPLLAACIVARRNGPASVSATTFLWYQRGIARRLWSLVGPVHRRIAPYLLEHAAAALTLQDRGAGSVTTVG